MSGQAGFCRAGEVQAPYAKGLLGVPCNLRCTEGFRTLLHLSEPLLSLCLLPLLVLEVSRVLIFVQITKCLMLSEK